MWDGVRLTFFWSVKIWKTLRSSSSSGRCRLHEAFRSRGPSRRRRGGAAHDGTVGAACHGRDDAPATPINVHAKVMIVDAKDKFSKQGLFMQGWEQRYGDMIEWVSGTSGGDGLSNSRQI